MTERYKILDAIMANPDPMIRQRLEMAYDAGRVSVLHEKNIFADDKDFNCAVTFQTAFTNRDNATLIARIKAKAKADAVREFVAEVEKEANRLMDASKSRYGLQSQISDHYPSAIQQVQARQIKAEIEEGTK